MIGLTMKAVLDYILAIFSTLLYALWERLMRPDENFEMVHVKYFYKHFYAKVFSFVPVKSIRKHFSIGTNSQY